jgi:hypothetical protein
LNNEIEKKLKRGKKPRGNQATRDLGHETMITHRKQMKTNYEAQFSINPMLKD